MILLSTPLIITFIILAVILLGVIIFIFLVNPIRKIYTKKHFNKVVYKKVYKIAQYKDFYLINNFTFTLDNVQNIVVDHILFGEKYIYVIMDKYYEGNISGKQADNSCIFVAKNGSKSYTDNPLLVIKKLLTLLCSVTGLPSELMVGLCITNNDCAIRIQSDSKQFYAANLKELSHLVKLVESRNVENINEEKLQEAVLIIDKINKKDRTK